MSTRSERRAMLKAQGAFKIKSKLSLSKRLEFIRDYSNNGSEIFNINKDAVEISVSEQFEQKELDMIEHWTELGYTQEEIEKLRESYSILTKTDKDISKNSKKYARNLIKSVNFSRNQRLHG